MEIVEDAVVTDKVMLTEDELNNLRSMNTSLTNARKRLGDLEMEKWDVLQAISSMRNSMEMFEKSIIERYGADSVINLQTGEVTQKPRQ
jgi:hypothetical protein